MPPDEPARSELDDALFGDVPEPARELAPSPPAGEMETHHLEVELFGEDDDPTGPIPVRTPSSSGGAERIRRLGLGVLVVFLVAGVGGGAYALFGRNEAEPTHAPKVEVKGSEVTRTTLRATTSSSPSTSTSTSSTSTTAGPTTSTTRRGTTPAQEPPATEPDTAPDTAPATEPPTTPTTPTLPPPPPTTTTEPTTTTTVAPPPVTG